MSSTQQKRSIYDQELLALVTALDRWSHLLRVARVTAHTNRQALTYLQRLQASKPLRESTAQWLDFLAKFPDFHIAYVQGLLLLTAGHDSILVMVDSLSKMPHFVPAKKSFTAVHTVELLADRLIRYHGFPEGLISD
ncbi:hypothetical protein ENH_00001560 [Eimeria necatrix]|uniref:Reverse transcriptase RNase H-like domain-containing protein n=1 Tax=Eimeria necatrix TaxID=51315 RepID=U6MDG3_9EIME|nr:hypothetical protein ENH_00001560 [Eimeria necatrix]CDJ62031.1 hypothetical protein ENH_00001560 [Eimeria necatrix]